MYFKDENEYYEWQMSGSEDPPAKCAYCECEETEDNPVSIRKYSFHGKHFKENICSNCLAEELAYENEKLEPIHH